MTADESLEKLLGIGRALERGRDIAPTVRTWMREVDQATVESALRANVDSGRNGDLRRAATRIAMQRGWSLKALPPAAAAAAPVVEHGGGADSGGPLLLSADALAMGVPPDDVVLAYIQKGSLAQYVEGVAATNTAFADELRETIDALGTAGESIGVDAKRWRGHDASVSVAVAVAVASPDSKVVGLRANKKATTNRTPIIAGQIALAAALILGLGGYYLFEQRHEREVMQALKDKEHAEKNAELARLMKELEQQQQAMALAQAEAANAKDEADRAAAQAKLVAAMEQQKKTQGNIAKVKATAAGGNGGAKAKAACTCQAGDPLCSCL